jgi:hypothetical protein
MKYRKTKARANARTKARANARTKARTNARTSRRTGGMWRRVAKITFDGIIGKNPIEKLDKAKQVADAVAKGMATQSQGTPVTPGTARTFSTPTIGLRIVDDFDRNITSPIENLNQNLYNTPVKRKGSNDDDDDNNLNPYRINRHYSRIVGETHSYAPTIYETRPVVRNLFD